MVTNLKLFKSPFKLCSRFHLHKSTNREQTTQKRNESKQPIRHLNDSWSHLFRRYGDWMWKKGHRAHCVCGDLRVRGNVAHHPALSYRRSRHMGLQYVVGGAELHLKINKMIAMFVSYATIAMGKSCWHLLSNVPLLVLFRAWEGSC